MNIQNRNIFAIAVIAVMITLSSCFSEVDMDIPEQFPKLVVGSFINPEDDAIVVTVTLSNPVFDNNEDINLNEIISNANVIMSDGNSEVNIPYDEFRGLYYLSMDQFAIQYGGTYSLQVSAPGYTSVSATTTVPLSTPVFAEAVVTDIDTNDQDYFDFIAYDFRFRWQDDGQESNRYRLYVAEANSSSYEITDKFFTDEDGNGQMITATGYVESYSFDEFIEFDVNLINASEDYYKYHRSLKNVSYGDPFAEPAIIYSNVKNGLGCFGGYTSTYIHITP